MKRWISLGVTGIVLSAGMAAAQTTPSASAPPAGATPPAATSAGTTSPGGAFDKLSPGGQRIARALFEAQRGQGSSTMSLDDIASRKLGGRGWGEVFKEMKEQGLVHEKNLGQVISRANRHAPPGSLDRTPKAREDGRRHMGRTRAKPEVESADDREGVAAAVGRAPDGAVRGVGQPPPGHETLITTGSGRSFGHDDHRPQLSETHRGHFGDAGRQAVTSGAGREFRAGGTGFARGGSGKGGERR